MISSSKQHTTPTRHWMYWPGWKNEEGEGGKWSKTPKNQSKRRNWTTTIWICNFRALFIFEWGFFSPLLHSCCTTQTSSCACHLCVLFRISFDFRCSSASIASIRLFIRWLLFGVFGANKYSNKCHFGLSFAVCGRMGFWIVRLCDCGCDYRVLFATVFLYIPRCHLFLSRCDVMCHCVYLYAILYHQNH